MVRTIRHATWNDLLSIAAGRRRQRVLRLNLPYTLIQPTSLERDLWKSHVPAHIRTSFVYAYVERGSVLGYVLAQCRRQRRDEWSISVLAQAERAPAHVMEDLLAEVCREAGEQGIMRLFVRVPKEEAVLDLFRQLGFTHYTSEHIWGNLYFGPSSALGDEPPHKPVRRALRQDEWDLTRLYSSVTPPAVQRAELLSSGRWHASQVVRPWPLSGRIAEKSYVWPDGGDGSRGQSGLGGYIRLLTGARAHWITLLFRPDAANRSTTSTALDYILWKAARQGNKPVYCGVRQYQAELGGELESRGFHPLSEQDLLIKYLAEPIKAGQRATLPFLVAKRGELVATEFSPVGGTGLASE